MNYTQAQKAQGQQAARPALTGELIEIFRSEASRASKIDTAYELIEAASGAGPAGEFLDTAAELITVAEQAARTGYTAQGTRASVAEHVLEARETLTAMMDVYRGQARRAGQGTLSDPIPADWRQ